MNNSIINTANLFKALGDETRLKIIKLIALKGNNLCVGMIAKNIEISQPAVSQHLSILKKAGLVKSSRYGSIIHYKMNAGRLESFKKSVKKYLGDEFILLNE